jgi:hypothetical protein
MQYNNWPSVTEEARMEGFYQYPEPIPGILCAGCGCAPTLMPAATEFYRERDGNRSWYCESCFGDILEGFVPMDSVSQREIPAIPLDDFDLQWWAIHLCHFNTLMSLPRYLRSNPLREPAQ